MYCIQLPSRPTSFRSISVKPYFQSKNTCNIKLDKLKVPAKLDKLEVFAKLDKLKVFIKLNKLKVLLPTLEVLQELIKSIKPAVKHS